MNLLIFIGVMLTCAIIAYVFIPARYFTYLLERNHRLWIGSCLSWVPPKPMQYTIVFVDGVYVLSDNVLSGGTKSRWLVETVQNTPECDTFIYHGSPFGHISIALQIAVMAVPNKRAIFVLDKRYEHVNPPYVRVAKLLGAQVIWSSTSVETAQVMADNDPKAMLLPKGGKTTATENGLNALLAEVIGTYGRFDAFFYTVGSGTIGCAVKHMDVADELYGVMVNSENFDPVLPGFSKIYHDQLIEDIVKQKFAPPFSSTANFDAKGWNYAKQYAFQNKSKRVLFWNVL